MSTLHNMNTTKKLFLLIGFGVLVACVQGVFGYQALNTATRLAQTIHEQGTLQVAQLGAIASAAQSAREQTLLHSLTADPGRRADLEVALAHYDEYVLRGLVDFGSETADVNIQTSLAEAEAAWRQYMNNRENVLAASRGGNHELAQNLATTGVAGESFRQAMQAVNEVLEASLHASGAHAIQVQRVVTQIRLVSLAIFALGALVLFSIGGVIFISVRRGEAERARLTAILEATPDVVAITNAEGHLQYLNTAGLQIMGLPPETDVRKLATGELQLAPADVLAEALPVAAREGVWRGETTLRRPGGSRIPVHLTVLAHRAAAGGIDYYSLMMRDIADRKQLETKLMHLALQDSLTGLANRYSFHQHLERRLQALDGDADGGAVLLIDLDNFKYVNDSLGHRAGDEVLAGVASVLRRQTRDTDMVARLGGDEFAVLLPQGRPGDAERLAQRMLQSLREQPVATPGQPVNLTASVGIAYFPEHGRDSEQVLGHADAALYQAKENGQNLAVTFAPDLPWKTEAHTRVKWEGKIREALAADGLLLESQPIRNLATGEIFAHELLLRMRGPDGEMVPPGTFLRTAEVSGQIREIDRWVIGQAVRLLSLPLASRNRLTLSVNISPKSFSDPDFLSYLATTLDLGTFDPRGLIFEITESAAIADADELRAFIQKVNRSGCRFAIDDFGTGHTSHTLLRQLPINLLKIDGSFIKNLAFNKADQDFVKAMTSIAHGLGRQVVAEYVGDPETTELLTDFGVDFGQGFFLGRPRPLELIFTGAAV